MTKIEYRVRPVTRYVVTRHHESEDGKTGGTVSKGEFDNFEMAYAVAYALCKEEHERLGFLPGDERIVYPATAASRAYTSEFKLPEMQSHSIG